ncbi:MAG: HAD hydrolase-like protein [Prevotella sp.]|nr:HAD hydrolase-like protein [Prevotella sp.]
MVSFVDRYLRKHGFEHWMPQTVLFDMDGVLYDSMGNHAIAWHEAMKSFGLDMTHHDAYATEGARGIDTIKMMVEKQQHRSISDQEAQHMYDEKTRQFHLMPEPPIMPGIPLLMQKIAAAGMSVGVVTGSGQRPLFARLLRDFGTYLKAERIVTAYDVKRGKPHPDPYLTGLQKAGRLAPWQAIVIENAPLGVRAAVGARIFTIAVNTGPLPEESLSSEGADLLFAKMTDLAEHWEDILQSATNE